MTLPLFRVTPADVLTSTYQGSDGMLPPGSSTAELPHGMVAASCRLNTNSTVGPSTFTACRLNGVVEQADSTITPTKASRVIPAPDSKYIRHIGYRLPERTLFRPAMRSCRDLPVTVAAVIPLTRAPGRPMLASMKPLLVLPLLVILAGCSADPYPLRSPPGASSWSPAAIGMPVRSVVLYLEPRPGDRVELIGAEAVGTLTGADVRFYFSPPVVGSDGSRTIGEKLESLAGARVAVNAGASPGPDNDVGIVMELTPRTAGTFSVTGIRLHFRLNSGSEHVKEGISQLFTVCRGPRTSELRPDAARLSIARAEHRSACLLAPWH